MNEISHLDRYIVQKNRHYPEIDLDFTPCLPLVKQKQYNFQAHYLKQAAVSRNLLGDHWNPPPTHRLYLIMGIGCSFLLFIFCIF